MTCGYRTCSGCREKDVTSSWRERHRAVLCIACDLDHGRVLDAAPTTEAIHFTLSPRAAAILAGVL